MMTEHEVLSFFAEMIEEFTGIPASRVTYEADLADDLEISSLVMVELIVSAEDKFNINITDGALKNLRTVQDMISYVQRMQCSGAESSAPGDSAPEAAAT